MAIQDEIHSYIGSQPEAKRADMQAIHDLTLKIAPDAKLWYLDGTNDEGKQVTNPNVGYGSYTINYADGSSREFYRVGFTGNTGGISFYIMGLDDKKFLSETYGHRIGKASITGYCIKFKALKDINIEVLEEAIRRRLK